MENILRPQDLSFRALAALRAEEGDLPPDLFKSRKNIAEYDWDPSILEDVEFVEDESEQVRIKELAHNVMRDVMDPLRSQNERWEAERRQREELLWFTEGL